MPILTKRPSTTISNGNWAKTPSGGTIAGILSDGSDTTFVSTASRSQLPSQAAVFDIDDISLPTGAKIFSVRVNVRVLQSTPVTGGSFIYDIIQFAGAFIETVVEDAITGSIDRLFATLFGFNCPTQPPGGGSPAWQTVSLAYNLEKPSGGEWTQDIFNALTWNLKRTDNNGELAKVSEWSVDIDYNEIPVVNVVGPTSPVTGTTRPLVSWTYTDPEGDLQSEYQVKVFNAAQVADPSFNADTSVPFSSSGWLAGQDGQWLVADNLTNDDYTAYVQVKQVWKGIGDHVSAWDSYTWTQAVPGPPQPLITAVPNNSQNWVQINLQPSSGSPATETYNVYYSDNAGVTYQLLRGGFQILADVNGLATVTDYEAPLNVARWYRALGFRTITTIKVASIYSDVAAVTPGTSKFWLKDPLAPSLNMAITVYDDKPRQDRNQGVFTPLSADGYNTFKIIVSGPLYGIEGDITFVFVGPDDTSGYSDFLNIIDSGRTLLLQYPTGEEHYIRFGPEMSQEWMPDRTRVLYRKVKHTYFEVAKPADPSAPSS